MTKPPPEFDKIQHHWLQSERSSGLAMAEWIDGLWYSAGESGSITPKEMRARGWEYHSPAIPPIEK